MAAAELTQSQEDREAVHFPRRNKLMNHAERTRQLQTTSECRQAIGPLLESGRREKNGESALK